MLAYNTLPIGVVGGMRREKVVVTVVIFGIVFISGVNVPYRLLLVMMNTSLLMEMEKVTTAVYRMP